MARPAGQVPHPASGGLIGGVAVPLPADGQNGGHLPGGADDTAFKKACAGGCHDDPDGVLAALHPAGQQGVVRENRAHPRHDGGVAVAVLVDPLPGLLPG